MAKGKSGLWIEGWKFSIYLALPLLASWYYNDPNRQKESVDYWKFVQYPSNPNTDMRKQIAEMQKQKEQREAYRQQMQELQEQARRSREAAAAQQAEEAAAAAAKKGWWRSVWPRKESETQA